MRGFEDVTLSWGGEDFIVPADKQLKLIAKLEDALSEEGAHSAIAMLMRPGGPPMSRLAFGYGAALRYAGAQVTDDEIYLALELEISVGDGHLRLMINERIEILLSVMAPNTMSKINALVDGGADGKKLKETDPA